MQITLTGVRQMVQGGRELTRKAFFFGRAVEWFNPFEQAMQPGQAKRIAAFVLALFALAFVCYLAVRCYRQKESNVVNSPKDTQPGGRVVDKPKDTPQTDANLVN